MTDPIDFDDATIADMTVALSQGRRVRFVPGSDPSASLDTGEHLDQSDADFLGTKLDEVKDLLGRGFEVNVHPDGSIYAFTADRSQRYLANPDATLDTLEAEFVRQSIRTGSTVVVEVDGSIAFKKGDGPAPDEAAITKRIAHFDEQLSSGKLAEAAAAGKNFEVAGDGTMSYVGSGATADTAADPATDPAADVDVVGDGVGGVVDDLDGDAVRMQAQQATEFAQQVREVSYDRLEQETTSLGLERDAAARLAWAAEQEANAADMQVKRELSFVDGYHEMAAKHQPSGDPDDIFAQQDAALAAKSAALANAAQARADAASARAAELRATAATATAEVARLEAEIDVTSTEYTQLSDTAEHLETRAYLLGAVARTDAAADAADEKAAELRAAGDEAGADAAAAEAAELHRSAAAMDRDTRAITVDEDVLAEAGIALPDDFVNPPPTAPATDGTTSEPATDDTTTTPPTQVIDMEPEVIEVDVPRVIDMEPEVIEVDVPRVIDMEPEVIEVDVPQPVDVEVPELEFDDQLDHGVDDTSFGGIDGESTTAAHSDDIEF